jgi:hypothetical protein
VHHLADRLEPRVLHLLEHVREPLVRPAGPGLAALGGDHDEPAGLLLRLLPQQPHQRPSAHRLIRDHEGAQRLVALRLEVDNHVLNFAPGGPREPVDQPLPQPAGARLGMGRDDDHVVVAVAERVHHGSVGVGVHDLAGGVDPDLLQLRKRHPQTHLGGLADVRVVDDVAVLGLVLRADDVDGDLALFGVPLGRVDELLARDRLVGYDEDALHSLGGGAPPPPAGTAVGSFSLNTACTAPGTPYS